MGPSESGMWESECPLAGARVVRPWTSYFPSPGLSLLPCKTELTVVPVSWVARKMIDKVFWCPLHGGAQ